MKKSSGLLSKDFDNINILNILIYSVVIIMPNYSYKYSKAILCVRESSIFIFNMFAIIIVLLEN